MLKKIAVGALGFAVASEAITCDELKGKVGGGNDLDCGILMSNSKFAKFVEIVTSCEEDVLKLPVARLMINEIKAEENLTTNDVLSHLDDFCEAVNDQLFKNRCDDEIHC